MAYYQYHHLNGVYFNTGIVPTIDTRIEIDNAGFLVNGSWPGIISSEGVQEGAPAASVAITGSQYSNHPAIGVRFGSAEISSNGTNPLIPVVDEQMYNIVLDKDEFVIDGVSYQLGGSFSSTPQVPFVFGARNIQSPAQIYHELNGYIGDVRIYQGGVLVGEFKPTIHNGEYTYYDTVSQTYLTKHGTGTIEPGPSAEVFEPSQYDFDFGFNGGTQTFSIEATYAWTCTAPTDFTISQMSGSAGTTTVTITAPSRISTVNDTVTFTDSQSNTFDISISQSVGTITPNLTLYQGADTIKKMYYGNGLV
mgnify:CR=1 FL=1